MMRNDEMRLLLDGEPHDLIADIKARDNALRLLRRAADEQPGIVPVLRETPRREFFHDVHDFLHAYHISRSSNALMRFWMS